MINSLKYVVICLAATLIPQGAHAAIDILIDQAEDVRFPIAIADIANGAGYDGGNRMLKDISKVIRADLYRSGYFFVIKPSVYRDRSDAMDASNIPWARWSDIGARGVVKGVATTRGGRTAVELRLFETSSHALQMGKRYTFDRHDWRTIAHRFADEILLATTGIRGANNTRIAYTVKTSRNKRKAWKQIYVMDADGFNPRRVTKDSSYNLGPAWAPDGRHVAFASYVGGFPDIYVADLETGQRRRLTANRSTNITPDFSPDGSLIAYSSGQGRDMEIFIMTNIGTDDHAFAPAFGIDIAPTFSPDGSELLFASERGGRLNLYRLPMGGGTARRITFGGAQNDSPDWSPDGTRIVFTRYGGGKYDIFTCRPDGSAVRRLTFVGSNEHPRWSPDSRFIVFSKSLGRKTQIYTMRFDGAHKTLLTAEARSRKKGASLPDWGPWPADYWE
jgi:TolB protein